MTARTSADRDGWAQALPVRRSRLRHAGFDARLAAEVAADPRYDLSAILDLVDRGCPPPLAARIRAPLEPPRR
jgi:hypothetical protein